MSTTKKHLISIRTNTNFNLNEATNNLTPQIELILLTQEPVYKANAKGEIIKSFEIGEFRLFTNTEGVNNLIGQLQILAANGQRFDQMSVGMNAIIESAKKQKESDDAKSPPEAK